MISFYFRFVCMNNLDVVRYDGLIPRHNLRGLARLKVNSERARAIGNPWDLFVFNLKKKIVLKS